MAGFREANEYRNDGGINGGIFLIKLKNFSIPTSQAIDTKGFYQKKIHKYL
ncbi:hypothetical protein [Pseudomonas syringae]|uniref:hypothetical protein n=1 Tax=Pseudomonas syringae TaxID=317 RepID=UPI0013796A52|nr:hypothetical protein [Pseudomonas syringae]